MADEQSMRVIAWWAVLSVVAFLNICAWIRVAVRQRRGAQATPPANQEHFPSWQLVLSALFVFGCAFRSFLPRSEGQRICLYDVWVSSATLGRAVATVAELALVAQFTIVLRECAIQARARVGILASYALLPLISVAEIFSWYTTLTTNFIGSVVEESIWALTAMLMTGTFVSLWSRLAGQRRTVVSTAIVMGVAYIAFMWMVDVPMYWARRKEDRASGKIYLSVEDGWHDAHTRRIQTRRWSDWRDEIPWMSMYFSVGVWISIALVELPRLPKQRS